MVQTDLGTEFKIDFDNPFLTNEKSYIIIIVVIKNVEDNLVEGANIKLIEDIKGLPGNWTSV